MKKNLVVLGILFSTVIIIGAGCQQITDFKMNTDLRGSISNENTLKTEPIESEAANQAAPTEKTQPKEQTGTAKVTFINKLSGTPIPGHMIRCTGCTNGDILESDLKGEIMLQFKTGNPVYFSAHRIDWHNYNQVMDIKPGDTIVVKTDPQVVDQGMRIFFPKTSYTKNTNNKTQLHITYKDAAGLPKTSSNIEITGPLERGLRKTARGITDANGKAVIDLPINGSYRISIWHLVNNVVEKTDFFQFEAPTGYTVNLALDYSKLNEMLSGTESLSKNFQERGMMLVCVREKETNKPIFASVMDSNGNIVTRTVNYNKDICTELPKSNERVDVMPTDQYNGLSYTSTAGVNRDGILYLYVEAK